LEEKLKMNPNDKDLVVMLHQVEFEKDGINMAVDSSLVVYGEDSKNTAMAKTVGLPLAIAATLILKGELALTGLHIPIIPEIYSPVLKELEKNDIVFEERIRNISN
jgi:saccharopine dehydrogenase-like NADP-dependent oxidoreductase